MNAPVPHPASAEPLTALQLSVPGMRCAGCIAKIESKLPLQPGIAGARVNFTAKRVAVTTTPGMTPPDVIAALADVGFEGHLIVDEVEATSRESKRLLRAVAVSGFAMMNIMLLSVSVWSGATGLTRDLFHWLSALIALPTVAYAGQPFFRSAWQALRKGRTNMDVPITIGVLITTALSLYETANSGPHAYFDGVVMLLFFLLAGRWLDSVMRDRAREGVTALLKQRAAGAWVEDAEKATHWVAADAVAPGVVMLVAAGERLAADGTVIQGRSTFDQSLLTGESVPVVRTVGDAVLAGTLNQGAPVRVRVTAAADSSAVADIARLMENAGQSRSRYVRIADRAARLYAPAVHTLAALSFAGWVWAGAGVHQSLLIAVAVLIITCPCALGLAVPAAQIVAAGALMRRGVLVKDGSALERMAEVRTALFDKTGTLTLGRPEPTDLNALTADDRSVVLALAQASRHPLSAGLRRALTDAGATPATLTDIAETAGQGMAGRTAAGPVALGRADVVDGDQLSATFTRADGSHVALAFMDRLRPDAAQTVAQLAQMGMTSAVLSGDHAPAVAAVGRALAIEATGGLTPQDKLARVQALNAATPVLMVGDGLNDGPALAAGHASIAPASASDVGQSAADMLFMGDSLAPVAAAVQVSRRTQAIVRQNFALAILYNVIAVPIAIMGWVTPLIAAAAMSGSSLIVVANALRLRHAGDVGTVGSINP